MGQAGRWEGTGGQGGTQMDFIPGAGGTWGVCGRGAGRTGLQGAGYKRAQGCGSTPGAGGTQVGGGRGMGGSEQRRRLGLTECGGGMHGGEAGEQVRVGRGCGRRRCSWWGWGGCTLARASWVASER